MSLSAAGRPRRSNGSQKLQSRLRHGPGESTGPEEADTASGRATRAHGRTLSRRLQPQPRRELASASRPACGRTPGGSSGAAAPGRVPRAPHYAAQMVAQCTEPPAWHLAHLLALRLDMFAVAQKSCICARCGHEGDNGRTSHTRQALFFQVMGVSVSASTRQPGSTTTGLDKSPGKPGCGRGQRDYLRPSLEEPVRTECPAKGVQLAADCRAGKRLGRRPLAIQGRAAPGRQGAVPEAISGDCAAGRQAPSRGAEC